MMAFPPCHSFMFQTHEDPDLHLANSSCPPQHFHGGGMPFMMKRSLSFSGVENNRCHHHDQEAALHGGGGGDDDLSDDGSQMGEKKKRLNLEQVKTLEKSFEMGNKLEPERKMQLAKALGLQPRQIAIWFQNRRARWKTKQLEKDYDVLKNKFDALKADNDALQAHNKKLQAELLTLKSKDSSNEGGFNFKKEIDQGSWSNGSENSFDHHHHHHHLNLEISRTAATTSSPPSDSPRMNGKNLFPPSSSSLMSASTTQLLQGSSRSDLQSLKLDQMIQDEGLCSMFNGIDQEQQGFWPWPEQQHFH
ncbi:hypothetical protein EV1_023323 [Malus domestica]